MNTRNIHSKYSSSFEKIFSLRQLKFMLPSVRLESLLTLFSKFFSFFLHSTCLLLITTLYVGLVEVYQRFTIHY